MLNIQLLILFSGLLVYAVNRHRGNFVKKLKEEKVIVIEENEKL